MADLSVVVLTDPSGPHLRLLDELPRQTRVVAGLDPEVVAGPAAEADVMVVGIGGARAFRDVIARARRIRWVHSLAAGVEGILTPEFITSPVPLTNARGVFARPLGEYALAAMLHFAKDLRRMVAQQRARVWQIFDVDELHGRTLGVVGYGEIGRAAAALAKPFGMRVLALKRRPELAAADPLVDAVFAPDRLQEMLAASDYVLAAAALTPETRGILGEAALRAMKKSAVVINLGRGPLVVEEALVRALREGWIRGAALDVFDTEPLPAGHPFYDMENVLLSPHCADNTAGWLDLTMRFFIDNFRRFAAGQPLENIVDKTKGY